jgi:hypothetical protein
MLVTFYSHTQLGKENVMAIDRPAMAFPPFSSLHSKETRAKELRPLPPLPPPPPPAAAEAATRDGIHQIVSRFLERLCYMCPLLFSCVFPS